MSGFKVNFSVNNQLATPSIHAAALANRPAAGQPGRVFIDTDNPSTGIYRDTGTIWVQIAETTDPEADTLQTVTDRGNTTTQDIAIGTSSTPSAPLDVHGTDTIAILQGTGTNNAFLQFNKSGNGKFKTGNVHNGGNDYFTVYNMQENADAILVNISTNNVAIGGGVVAPSYRLDVQGSFRTTGAAYLATSGGNVGIGTTSVNSSLEIYKASGTNYIYLTNGTSGTNNGVVLRYNNIDYMGMTGAFTSGELKVGGFNAGGYFMTFYSNNAERMRLTPSGRLLLGTSTESTYLLDVNGTTRISGTELRLDNGTTGTLNIYSNTPTINFFSGGGYTLGRSGTEMTWNSGGSINLKISSNDAYSLSAANGHLFRSAIAGGAFLARLDTGGSLSIGNGSTAANVSSILDLTSTTKGFLPPRMTGAQAEAIGTPAAGLLVYANNGNGVTITTTGWWGYDGATWVKLN